LGCEPGKKRKVLEEVNKKVCAKKDITIQEDLPLLRAIISIDDLRNL
jgi:hypothetical protein